MLTSKIVGLFVFLTFTWAPTLASGNETRSNASESKKFEVEAVPVRRSDLQRLPQEQLPSELREELRHPESPLQGSKNTWFDYLLVGVRSSINATSITLGFVINMNAPVELAILPGLLGGAMSGSLQLFHPQISHWLEHKSEIKSWYDLKGVFRLSEAKKASFIESFFFKEFSVNIVYLNALQILSGVLKIQPDIFSWRPMESAALGLGSEGVLYVLIAHLTEKFVAKYPDRGKFIWHMSKIASILTSIISTFGTVMFLMHKPWAPSILAAMTLTGGTLFVATNDRVHEFLRRLNKSPAILKPKQICGNILKSLF